MVAAACRPQGTGGHRRKDQTIGHDPPPVFRGNAVNGKIKVSEMFTGSRDTAGDGDGFRIDRVQIGVQRLAFEDDDKPLAPDANAFSHFTVRR
ncbi:hypothetical protein DJICPGNB_17515 [Escherichia coli]|nr:hypothetical protein DJICPGNB_17515 [Escherichia coli]